MSQIKILLCALSDPINDVRYPQAIADRLRSKNMEVDLARSTLEEMGPYEKAEEINQAFEKDCYDWILDISGGDLANETLPYLDYDAYANCRTVFGGFSDLSCVLNALYAMTGKRTLLFAVGYQKDMEETAAFLKREKEIPFSFESYWQMEGDSGFIGGNIRCFLKLAGTPYFPVCEQSILILESMSCSENALYSMMNQLGQMGVFEQVDGIIFGVFSRIYQNKTKEEVFAFFDVLMNRLQLETLNWAVTLEVGHIENSKPVWIGD